MQIKNLKQTCGACPSQWEFITDNNRPVYVRYRWGYLSVRVGEPNADIYDAVVGAEVYGGYIGDEWDGMISWDDVEKRIKDVDLGEFTIDLCEFKNKL